ncbi:MAG TPA: hypothetical protein DDW23_01325, partial [Planctomycetes bacterium]|nr:hypothetical protein [Planctomycetota bacterium]
MREPESHFLPRSGKVLVVRLSALGDVIKTIPAMRALSEARPDLHLEWLIEDQYASLVESLPFIKRTWVFPRKKWASPAGWLRMTRHLAGIAGGQWDAVLDFQVNPKSQFQAAITRAPIRITRKKDTERRSIIEQNADLIRGLGANIKMKKSWKWPLPNQCFQSADLKGNGYPVILHADTTIYGRDKAWPDSYWINLATELKAKGVPVQFLRPPSNSRIAILAAEAGCSLTPLAPNIPALAYLLDHCRGLVGTDSGPTHLAAYRTVPTVALFGATDPAIHAPCG